MGRYKTSVLVTTAPPRTIRDYVLWAERRFSEAGLWFGHGTDNALDEAAWLIGSTLGLAPRVLDEALEHEPGEKEQARIHELVDTRIATRKPAAYLLNEAWFAGLRFYVDERVIVPRSLIGEYIQEKFQPWIAEDKIHKVLDLCTGGGCFAVAIAMEFPNAQIDAVDISDDALAVAKINIDTYNVGDRVRLIQSDLFSALVDRRYELIVSNPPYVARDSLDRLPAEYRFEPERALVAEDHGLKAITSILSEANKHLNPGGLLLVEVGESRDTLEHRYPEIPFTWLAHESGEEAVFLVTAGELAKYTKLLQKVARMRPTNSK